MIQLTNIMSFDEYTFSHSVNVCAIATLLGVISDYSPKRLTELALGAILHDIGKIKIPLSILNKKDRLTDEEMQVMKKHSEYGFDLLRATSHLSVVPMHG
jgi:HD-GYP domain-containing protein (c-di-GMP phosphodiesterase class II)